MIKKTFLLFFLFSWWLNAKMEWDQELQMYRSTNTNWGLVSAAKYNRLYKLVNNYFYKCMKTSYGENITQLEMIVTTFYELKKDGSREALLLIEDLIFEPIWEEIKNKLKKTKKYTDDELRKKYLDLFLTAKPKELSTPEGIKRLHKRIRKALEIKIN